MSPDLTVG
jgi:hypothetical protein